MLIPMADNLNHSNVYIQYDTKTSSFLQHPKAGCVDFSYFSD